MSALGWAFDLVLAGLILLLGWRAVAGREPFAGIVAYIVYGLLLAVAWVRLGAPDVALAEAAIGAGLTGVLLLGTLGRIGSSDPRPESPGTARDRLLLVPLCALLAIGLGAAVLTLPLDRPGLAEVAMRHLPESGVENPVTAVLLNYRSYDTLLETGVLLLALLGAWSLLPGRAEHAVPGRMSPTEEPGATLDAFVRVLVPVAVLIGVYLLWAGSHAPGGAFQAGTVLAAAVVLPRLAGLEAPVGVGRVTGRVLATVGFLLFLGVGIHAMATGRDFLAYPEGMAKSLILLIEVVLTVSIAAILALLVAGDPAPLRRPRR